MIDLKTPLKLSNDIRYRHVLDEAVLIRQKVGEIVALNHLGGRVLDLLQTESNVAGVLAILEDEFEVEPPRLEKDVLRFVLQLIEEGIVLNAAEKF